MSRIPGRIAALAIKLATPLLRPIERRLVKRALKRHPERHAPIFIIGAPRSGSTLLYKVLTDSFGLAFFNNLTSRFYRTPYLGSLLSRALGIQAPRGFDIRYGTMRGWGSPHECGPYWYRWFPRGMEIYTSAGVLSPSSREQIRDEVFAVSTLHGAPMTFKNLFNSMRIGALVETFPEASFIVCRRDPLQNALSLLRGRIEQNGDKSAWWTLPPREVRQLRELHYADQVAGQVYWTNRQIEQDAATCGRERFMMVDYEAFCADVHGTLRRTGEFLVARGCAATLNLDGIPATFSRSRVAGLDAADEAAVEAAVRSLYDVDANA